MRPTHFSPAIFFCAALLALLQTNSVAHAVERVYFEEPLDNAQVTSPVAVKFGLEGMRVAPTRDKTPGTGHYHLIIDGEAVPKGVGIDVDESHIHYNTGLSSAKIELPPGVHTLTLQFGSGRHESYGPEMSSTITVTVKPK